MPEQPRAINPSPEGQERTTGSTGQTTSGRKVEGQATTSSPVAGQSTTPRHPSKPNR